MSNPAIPRAIRERQGNPSKRPLPPDVPGAVKMPSAPRELSKTARAEWRRMAKILTASRLVTVADRAALAGYCATWAQWLEVQEQVQREGLVISQPSGRVVQNPAVQMAISLSAELRRWAVEFGLTPSSRTKVQPIDGGDQEDEITRWAREHGKRA